MRVESRETMFAVPPPVLLASSQAALILPASVHASTSDRAVSSREQMSAKLGRVETSVAQQSSMSCWRLDVKPRDVDPKGPGDGISGRRPRMISRCRIIGEHMVLLAVPVRCFSVSFCAWYADLKRATTFVEGEIRAKIVIPKLYTSAGGP